MQRGGCMGEETDDGRVLGGRDGIWLVNLRWYIGGVNIILFARRSHHRWSEPAVESYTSISLPLFLDMNSN